MLHIINSRGANGDGFADDLLVKASMKIIQEIINELTSWGKQYGLRFNPDKTVVVLFGRRKISDNNYPQKLQINGSEVDFSDSMRYLGVTLDKKNELERTP